MTFPCPEGLLISQVKWVCLENIQQIQLLMVLNSTKQIHASAGGLRTLLLHLPESKVERFKRVENVFDIWGTNTLKSSS